MDMRTRLISRFRGEMCEEADDADRRPGALHRLLRLSVARICGVIILIAIAAAAAVPHPVARVGGQATGPVIANEGTLHLDPGTVKPFRTYGGLWRTDGGFVSTIHLKNELATQPLRVAPVLYMRDGAEYDLPAVQVPVQGTVDVDVNQALQAIPEQLRPHLSSRGSVELRYQCTLPAILASMQILDTGRSLIFDFPLNPILHPETSAMHTLEALWWRHDHGIQGFVALTNFTSAEMEVDLAMLGGKGSRIALEPVRLSPHTQKYLRLGPVWRQLPEDEREAGTLEARWQGAEGSLGFDGGLVNEREGYSATMPAGMMQPDATSTRITYGSTGIMLGRPDAAMGFPAATRFELYAVLANTTDHLLEVHPELTWMRDQTPEQMRLPAIRLAAHTAIQLPSHLLLAEAGIEAWNGTLNLAMSFTGKPGDLFFTAGSVDQSGTYVFEAPPHGISRSYAKEAIAFSLTNGNDTMLSLWNPATAPEDLVATFRFSNGAGEYRLPLHLEGNGSATIDLKDLILRQTPDPDGNIFPFNVQDGSITIASSAGAEHWINVAENVAIFNVQTATCGVVCTSCCGYGNFAVVPNQEGMLIWEYFQVLAQDTFCSGSVEDQTSYASWSSNVASTISVDNGSYKGRAEGLAIGGATLSADLGVIPVYTGQICNSVNPQCPNPEDVAPSGNFTVDSLSYSISSPPVPNDASGIIAKSPFTLNVQANLPAGGLDSAFNGTFSVTVPGYNASLGESAPSSITFTNGQSSASLTLVSASGTSTAPSSIRQIVVNAQSVASNTVETLFIYWKVTMDVELATTCGTMCGYSVCPVYCAGKPLPAGSEFIALPDTSVCGASITVYDASTQRSGTTTVQDIGPHSTSNPYWFTGNYTPGDPTSATCGSDAFIVNELGGSVGCAYGNQSVYWRFTN